MRQASNGTSASAPFRGLAAIVAAAILAACQPGGDATTPGAKPAPGVPLLATDIESPEIFSVEDRGLWDGRPSLGGVWVAAPGVTTPERVLIRVPETGRSVVGALFRREREFAGPPLQLSSEAAEALGIYAGAPTVVKVVALRRAEAPDISAALPPPPAATPVQRPSPGPVAGEEPVATMAPRGTPPRRLLRRDTPSRPMTAEASPTAPAQPEPSEPSE